MTLVIDLETNYKFPWERNGGISSSKIGEIAKDVSNIMRTDKFKKLIYYVRNNDMKRTKVSKKIFELFKYKLSALNKLYQIYLKKKIAYEGNSRVK